ncbi:MAG: hypothetical protein F6K19_35885 [Cyanothece sp. SIO1E1]|nr:hypothetical protein [Cyanothece sp. SIO1E1]
MSNPPPDAPQPQPPTAFELDLLKQEYFFLQTAIEDYNKQMWAIKALGITGTGLVINLVLQEKQGSIALIGCAIPIFFWVLESQWKHFQRGFYRRVEELERILCDDCNLRGPAIFGSWSHTFKRQSPPRRTGYLWDGLLNRSVYVSYVLAIAFLLALYLAQRP